MQLTYRGSCYNHRPQRPIKKGTISGKYRGEFWQKSHLGSRIAIHSFYCLKYRGAHYFSTVYIQGKDDLASAND